MLLNKKQEQEITPQIQKIFKIITLLNMPLCFLFVNLDIKHFICTGKIRKNLTAFQPAFKAFQHSFAAQLVNLSKFSDDFFATHDFIQIIPQALNQNYCLVQ